MLYMNCYSKRCISLITLIISIIIFIQTNFLTIIILSNRNKTNQNYSEEKTNKMEEYTNTTSDYEENWQLIIPKIDVSAQIKDGVGADVINNYIGHFEETPYFEGNVGLIAANNGYKENYFANLETLENDDIIIYKKGSKEKIYKVINNVIIKDTDWSYLSSTKDNRITLITGVIDKEEERRCVQAIEAN